MFAFDTDYDPIAPAGDGLIAELGLDARSIRDTLADDRARRCPEPWWRGSAPRTRSRGISLTDSRRCSISTGSLPARCSVRSPTAQGPPSPFHGQRRRW